MAVGAAVALFGVATLVDRANGPHGPDHPDRWDPRVAELAAFVEDERGLAFEHPVYVDFLSAAEYAEASRATVDEGDLDDDDADERAAALLRALGLAQGEIDLDATDADVVDIGTLAYYDRITERVVVRGTTMTPDLEVTLVHELTHALQDQAFDLDAYFAVDDAASVTARRGLVEGDAVRIEERYLAGFGPDDRAAYDAATEAAVAGADTALGDAPPDYVALLDALYGFGVPFALALEGPGGPSVDDAFDTTGDTAPSTEEHLADPTRYLAGDDPVEVDPALLFDDEPLEVGTIGWIGWYLLLAERLDAHDALKAVDGWDGDAYAILPGDPQSLRIDEDGPLCVVASIATDTEADADELAAALTEWSDAQPRASIRRDRGAERIVVESCDPGPDADLGVTGRGADALALPVTRSYVVADALHAFDPDDARCIADAVVAPLSIEQLLDPAGTVFTDGTYDRLVADAVAACTGS